MKSQISNSLIGPIMGFSAWMAAFSWMLYRVG
jgi:hypothetical protein